MSAVTVYSKPACVQCDRTKRKLTQLGATFTEVDVTEDPGAYAYVTGLGYSSAPVVVVNNGGEDIHFAGYRPDLISEHVEA